MIRAVYASVMHRTRHYARTLGVLSWLERNRDNPAALWARSLFAIYDIDDLNHLDLPWWCFDAITVVDEFLVRKKKQARVLEYGSGASTLWLARRAKQVISVEHDTKWYSVVSGKLSSSSNVDLRLVPPDAIPHHDKGRYTSTKRGWRGQTFYAYVHTIDAIDGDFDLIVIDGRCRVGCLQLAMYRLAPDGIIVFDNSARRAYRQAISSVPLASCRHRGLTACLPYPDETTILVKS